MTILMILVLVLVAVIVMLLVSTQRQARQAEAMVPQRGKLAEVAGGSIHHIDVGKANGTPVVLIHGISGQLQHFDYGMIEDLALEHRVIALDRPGCGYSRRDSDAQSPLSEQARMIWELLDQLEVEKPVLVGHSLGGAVVLNMALQRPDGTGAIALLSPATHAVEGMGEVFKPLMVSPDWLRKVMGATIAVPMAKRTTEEVLAAVFAPERPRTDFLSRGGAALGLRPKGFVTSSRDAVAVLPSLQEQQARYGELSVPGGVLYAAEDGLLDPASQGEVMQGFGLSYDTLEGRGHMLPITAAKECTAFVRKIAAQRRA
ncbi:alpha/beta fold hydrolase [Rhodobacteraceae bacterium D3-12]|nr:alpha/beta fold hydrolase [Rhodobacteraceae bacterium D3-12]